MFKLVEDANLQVRYQQHSRLRADGEAATKALHQIAAADAKDQWMRLAILTSAHGRRANCSH